MVETVTVYRSRPVLVMAVRNAGHWTLIGSDGQRSHVEDAEFQARFEPATAADVEQLAGANGSAPRPTRRPSPPGTARKASGARSGRTSPPAPEILARAKELWRAGESNDVIAKAVAAMGRPIKPAGIYGWADRYSFGPRGAKNGGGKKNGLNRSREKAPAA